MIYTLLDFGINEVGFLGRVIHINSSVERYLSDVLLPNHQ